MLNDLQDEFNQMVLLVFVSLKNVILETSASSATWINENRN